MLRSLNLVPFAPVPIDETLQRVFEAVISPRRPIAPLFDSLQAMDKADQTFCLHWLQVIARSNVELAYHVGEHLAKALTALSQKGTRLWVLQALDVYDQEGLYPAVKSLTSLDEFAQQFLRRHSAALLSNEQHRLAIFIRGLSGRDLAIDVADIPYTDTETLYLPARIDRYPDKHKNAQFFKVVAVFLWAQTRFGTFKRADVDAPTVSDRLETYDDPIGAESLFMLLESVRLMACLERELPGLHRQMNAISPLQLPHDKTWQVFASRLRAPEADVNTTFIALTALLKLRLSVPHGLAFQGRLNLAETERVMQERQNTESQQLMQQMQADDLSADALLAAAEEQIQSGQSDGALSPTGDSAALSPAMRQLVESLLQDFDQLPMQANGELAEDDAPPQFDPLDESECPTFWYDEWDVERQHYRQDWCRVLEREVTPVYDRFSESVMQKYRPLVREIRRVFEGIRDQPLRLRRQFDGDDVDIDAVIDAQIQRLSGEEISDRVYLRHNRIDRSVAVMLTVDVSGSTKGWINEAERESLILICEALEILDDEYAIYAFSGMTRQRCEIFPIKTFSASYDDETRARIGGLMPKYYTRMGASIRHLTEKLKKVEARHRVLLVLSDGKPDDYDGYKGRYGIEDTRKALLEAQAIGIKPFCITIDSEAQDYLPHLFGENGYVMLDDVGELPKKVAAVYRRLTTR